jgi:pSer/pThr/pTyr-binding forkhead associated (FHA) protein
MRVALRVTAGRNAGKDIPIGPRFLIGRGDDCQLKANSTQISRHHCELLIQDEAVWVRDCGSRNGTFVAGERITAPQRLNNGDALQLGPLQFEILIRQDPVDPLEAAPQDTHVKRRGDTSHGGKLKTALRKLRRREQATDESEILGILSMTVERRIEPLPELVRQSDVEASGAAPPAEEPKTAPKRRAGPVLPAAPVDSADAAVQGLRRLFTPKRLP